MYAYYAGLVVGCIIMLPGCIIKDVKYHLTGQFMGSQDWVAKRGV